MLKMSDQFLGCVQKALLKVIDIIQLFRDIKIENDENLELIEKNPPSFKVNFEKEEKEKLQEKKIEDFKIINKEDEYELFRTINTVFTAYGCPFPKGE